MHTMDFICFALILVLGAWSSEAISRRLQDALMYGRYELWIARYVRVHNDINEKEKRLRIFMENVALTELNLPIKMQTNLTN